MSSVSRARWHGKNTEILLPVEGENSCGKIQSSHGAAAARTVEDNKKRFLNKIMAVGSAKMPLACSRLRMVTSQAGTGTRLRCSMHPLPPPLSRMDQGGPSALSWRATAVTMINSLINPSLLLQLDPYKSMGLDETHPTTLKEQLMPSQNLS